MRVLGVRVKPRFWCDLGNVNHFERQYGERYSDGLMALNVALCCEWDIVPHLTLYAEFISLTSFPLRVVSRSTNGTVVRTIKTG